MDSGNEVKAGGLNEGVDPSDAASITSTDVVVRYGQIMALDHFSVAIPHGIVGLLGPNGAGKSTFIKAVLGLVQPQSGSITISGLDSRVDTLAIRDRVGYMPEHDCLIDAMPGVELVSYMGRLSGMAKGDSIPRSHEVLDFVGIGEERYRPVGSYSTGMKQRVKLAQAIVHDPDIMFLDEPTNGMDPNGREEMLELIGRIAASDKSILVSSHILHDVEEVCKEAIIINNGRVVVKGPLETLLSQGSDRKSIKVKGTPDRIRSFIEALGKYHNIITVTDHFGLATIVFLNPGGSRPVLELAHDLGVQVRSYLPDRITLEDVFIKAVTEVR
ncbi:MAG TPA: ABC transporter ATP-binding protein [Methanomassiliicoccales archaeon]|jgi:ABC-2 type transport system ATP-binding protein